MDKSSWVPSHTQDLFSTCCRWYCIPWVLQELLLSRCGGGVRPRARLFYVVLPMMLFVGLDHKLACIWKRVCDVSFKTILLPLLHLNMGCNTLFVLLCTLNYLWTYVTCGLHVESCMILVVCWIIRDPSWYSMDYQVYMGPSMIVQSLWWLPLYLCSYKLVGSATAIALAQNLISIPSLATTAF